MSNLASPIYRDEEAKSFTNPIEKVDFKGLLALYKKVGNQEKIDEIITMYLDHFQKEMR